MSDILYIIGIAIWIALSSCPLALTHCCCCKAGMIIEQFTHSGISSDWEVRSGTWTNPSGTYYQTSSTDAVILLVDPLSIQDSHGIVIQMNVRGEPRDTKVRIIFGWQDDSNFYAVEVRTEQRTSYQGCNDTPSFGYYIFGKIIQVVGGVETDVAGESHSFIEGGGFPINGWFIMACYNESDDPAAYNTHLLFNIASGPGVQQWGPTLKCYLPPLGRRVGIGTGDLVTNPAQFDALVVNCSDSCSTWLPCNVVPALGLTAGGCLPATQPTEIEASFAGLVPQVLDGPCGTVASPCDAATCTALDGPFLLSKEDPCTWSYATPIAHCGTLYQPDGQDFFYTIHVQIKPGSGANIGKMVAEVVVTEVLDDPSVCKVFTGTFVIVASNPGDCRATASGFLTPSLWCANSCKIESTLFTLVLSA